MAITEAAEFLFCRFRKFREIRGFLSNRQSESPLSRCFGSHQEICPVRVTCTIALVPARVRVRLRPHLARGGATVGGGRPQRRAPRGGRLQRARQAARRAGCGRASQALLQRQRSKVQGPRVCVPRSKVQGPRYRGPSFGSLEKKQRPDSGIHEILLARRCTSQPHPACSAPACCACCLRPAMRRQAGTERVIVRP
jgi:hypothetical protein